MLANELQASPHSHVRRNGCPGESVVQCGMTVRVLSMAYLNGHMRSLTVARQQYFVSGLQVTF
jgi:hypothetical protein